MADGGFDSIAIQKHNKNINRFRVVVPTVQLYRYFLGFRSDLHARHSLSAAGKKAGQAGKGVPEELLHLTLCVVGETRERDPFLPKRVEAALAGQTLASIPIPLGRVKGGALGAAARTIGPQDAIQDFYSRLVRLLASRDINPLHRASGLHPHVTLRHDRCDFTPFMIEAEWIPDELLLIESEVGLRRHNVLQRWPLLGPTQGWLPFGEGPFPSFAVT